MTFRILTCDGGGFRGLYTARVLERLEETTLGYLEKINLFAGTSTGAILACALAKGLKPADIVRLYKEKGAFIFQRSWWDKVKDLGNLVGAEYKQDNLRKCLVDVFGKTKMGELPKSVLVVSFDLDTNDVKNNCRRWKPKIWNNVDEQDKGTEVVEVLLTSTAAPTFFPSYKGYVDGGVCANNPAMCALSLGMKMENRVDSVRLLSVGTGINGKYIPGDTLDWGVGQWAKDMANLMIDGDMDVVDYQCQTILGAKYLRLNKALGGKIDLADVSKAREILLAAEGTDVSKHNYAFWE